MALCLAALTALVFASAQRTRIGPSGRFCLTRAGGSPRAPARPGRESRMRRPNILLFGGSGQIGEALRSCAELRTPDREVRAVPWPAVASDVDEPSRLR